ncbi:MAG: response regulator transcription factor [Polaribacter sp.]|nr:response regulator transcription factor [Polaribacter sp.]
MKKYSVVVVDDHTLLSQAIQSMVDTFDKFTVLYTCKNGQELIDMIAKSPNDIPNVILMDVNMPIMNGIEATALLTQKYPSVHVMALSVEDDDNTILKMLKAGAIGYLLKDTEKAVLENALIEIVENGFYHTKNVTNLLMKSVNGLADEQITLKEHETTFLKLACTEMTYREIADQMCLSPKTIDGYRDALFTKCNVKNRVGLVIYAIKNKIYTV